MHVKHTSGFHPVVQKLGHNATVIMRIYFCIRMYTCTCIQSWACKWSTWTSSSRLRKKVLCIRDYDVLFVHMHVCMRITCMWAVTCTYTCVYACIYAWNWVYPRHNAPLNFFTPKSSVFMYVHVRVYIYIYIYIYIICICIRMCECTYIHTHIHT